MMKFDFGGVAEAQESGRRLVPGIHEAEFLGVEFTTVEINGESSNALKLKLNVKDYGEISNNFLEPRSADRTTNQWGGQQPSQLDHFMIAVKVIMDALDDNAEEHLKKMSGLSFKQLVEAVKKATSNSVGKTIQVKLIPNSKGFPSIPAYPAGVSSTGKCTIATRFIGEELTLTPSEQKRIEAANNAKPTNMATANVVANMAADLNAEEDSDLPF